MRTADLPNDPLRAAVLTTARLDTPIGPMLAGATDAGLALLEFADPDRLGPRLAAACRALGCAVRDGPHPLLDRIASELAEYFDGRREAFGLPLVLAGTRFERDAWEALRAIPYGQTRSYADQARALGRPAAVRAVGRANGRNRLAIVVPCHRVVASGGGLCGYGGGLWRKQFLIELERRRDRPVEGGSRPGVACEAGEGGRPRAREPHAAAP